MVRDLAVYEKKLPFLQRIITRVYGVLEAQMNSRFNRKIITFFYRHAKLGKVTKLIQLLNIDITNLNLEV